MLQITRGSSESSQFFGDYFLISSAFFPSAVVPKKTIKDYLMMRDGVPPPPPPKGRPLRVLVVTHRRSLADKLCKDLEAAGAYVNYLHVNRMRTGGTYKADKLIVQLDSMPSVYPEPYDIVIIDEVLSTVLHTRSDYIGDHTAVISSLEFFMQHAKQVILLDAAADDMPAYNFVCNLERIMSAGAPEAPPVSAYWIHNKYVRPNNRLATLHICTAPDAAAFQAEALRRVQDLVMEQPRKRVFAPCSTASHAKAIGAMLNLLNKEKDAGIRFKVITGSSTDAEKSEVNRNIEAELMALDVFVCSPAITAGPSFEAKRFDHMVQYAENAGGDGCTVDSVLQQGARVRCLGEDVELPDDPDAPVPEFTPGSNACIDIFVLDRADQRRQAGPLEDALLDSFMQVHTSPLYCHVANHPRVIPFSWTRDLQP